MAPHLFTAGNLRLDPNSREWDGVAGMLGVEAGGIRLIRQVHGVAVACARKAAAVGWTTPDADVIVSDDEAVAIGVRVADCAPVLIADRRIPVVAAAHAGWRGTMQAAAAHAVQALREEFGSDPRDLVAAIGPCLGPCCGEVGPEVVDAFREAGHDDITIDRWFTSAPGGRPHLDLWRANRDQLERAGIPAEHIHLAGLCTKTHSAHLHSYRVAGPGAGRMVGAIRVNGGRRP